MEDTEKQERADETSAVQMDLQHAEVEASAATKNSVSSVRPTLGVKVFVARLSPRMHRRDKPRGTLIDNRVDVGAVDPTIDYEEYYQATVGSQVLPDPLLIEFGQPPTSRGELLVKPGDILVLLVGADDPDGSTNPRGIIGLAVVEATHVVGSGQSARCALRAKPILQLQNFLDNSIIRQSDYRPQSKISDIAIFGLDRSPQAHNFVRFFESGDNDAEITDRLEGLLGMFQEVDPSTKEKLSQTYPLLAELIPDAAKTSANESLTSGTATTISKGLVLAACAKPLIILTGPSGTGKSRLAIDMALALDYGESLPPSLKSSQRRPGTNMAFVTVGADWTDQRALLGYPNPFGPKRTVGESETNSTYETVPFLDLLGYC